jgi:hypothetical protein
MLNALTLAMLIQLLPRSTTLTKFVGRAPGISISRSSPVRHTGTETGRIVAISQSHLNLSRMSQRIRKVRDFSWTTGGDPDIQHLRLLGRGGFAEVHEVI